MAASTPLAIEARALGRRYGRSWALAHLDLEVAEGEALLVAGANGSGKTTLLRIVSGLLRPTAGEITVLGADPRSERLACRSRLSLVSHRGYLYERLTALESVRLWGRAAGKPADGARLAGVLAEVGLTERASSLVSTFSAGMRKRLTLARSRIEEPDLLLLDEPFAALDAEGQELVAQWVRETRDRGATVVVASHQLRQASVLCDRAILLEDGQRVWRGAAAELPERVEAGA
ncbi:MAG: heme ABC exporter ATP-binding protein CcmA [Acidobacteriota bacterium]|nr:heme ABC exporter ATP-binding protein CcmA [Acidobacteriota bacterium]